MSGKEEGNYLEQTIADSALRSSKRIILLSPVDEIDPYLLNQINEEIVKQFGFCTKTISLLSNIDFAYDQSRRQYHSTPILKELTKRAPDDAFKVLAITRVDLFIPILTHVYGEAQLDGRSCIVSTFRLMGGLNPGGDEYLKVKKEAIHELGHTFNLRHCKDPSCLMHYCRSEKDVDRKSEFFCRYCLVLLKDELKQI